MGLTAKKDRDRVMAELIRGMDVSSPLEVEACSGRFGTEWAAAPGRAYLGTGKKGGNEWVNQALFSYHGAALPALGTLRAL